MSDESRSSTDDSMDNSEGDKADKAEKIDKPHKLECCQNIKMFTVFLCLLTCMNGSIAASYLPAVLTTIEQKFKLGSFTTGLIVSSYEIGATIAVMLVSFLGHHSHIPLILGWGSLIIGVGTVVFSLPHFIAPTHTEDYVLGLLTTHVNSTSTIPLYCSTSNNVGNTTIECADNKDLSERGLYIAIFIIAQTLIGVGSSPILTIGLTYIDNHVSTRTSSTYISFVYAASVLGSVVGYGCGAAMLEIYIDFIAYSPSLLNLTSKDENLWLGAWWAGFLLFAVIICAIAPWFCMFPKSMSKVSSSENLSTDSDSSVNRPRGGTTPPLKEMPRFLWILMKNPVYMLLNIGGTFVMLIVTGFLTFAPKFIETQFYISRTNSSLITGGVAIPSAVLGVVVIGYIIQRYKLSPLGAIKSVCLMNIVALCCFGLAFVVGCGNIDIAGITVPYNRDTSVESLEPDLNNTCNIQCHCDDQLYNPICHGSTTYISYCQAGCYSKVNESDACSCTRGEVDVEPAHLVEGECESTCTLLPAFLVLLAIFSFTLASIKTPITIIVFRCVDKNLKSFALGVQVVIIRLFALLPAPILYGTIIDSSCKWWRSECGVRQNCIIHDNNEFRVRFTAISFGFHFLGTLMFIIVWLILRKDESNSKFIEEKENDMQGNAQDNRGYVEESGDGIEVTKL